MGTTFDEFVGDREKFFTDYFDRAPMLRCGALAHRLDEFPTPADLDDILALETVAPSYLRVSKGGAGVPRNSYTRTVARGGGLAEAVDGAKVHELFRSGATITWNAMQHFLPSTRRLTEVFAEALAATVEVVLFVTPAGNPGFAPHHDSVDVFVVQTHGRKTWRVWATPEERAGDEASHTTEELGRPELEATLTPGDVLYVPHGTPHAAVAQAAMSLHLSVGVEPRRWRDLVRDTVEALLGDARLHGVTALTGRPVEVMAEQLSGHLARLAGQLSGVDGPTEVCRLAETGRTEGGGRSRREFARLAMVDGLTAASQVRRSDVAVDIGVSDGGRTGLTVNNHQLAVPDAVATALRSLETGRSVTADQFFPGVAAGRSIGAARGLARLGVLEIADQQEDVHST